MASPNGRVVAPAQFPPPVDSRQEFIKRELDDEEERIEVGVAIVGGGPAGLACANKLLQLLADERVGGPEVMERLGRLVERRRGQDRIPVDRFAIGQPADALPGASIGQVALEQLEELVP